MTPNLLVAWPINLESLFHHSPQLTCQQIFPAPPSRDKTQQDDISPPQGLPPPVQPPSPLCRITAAAPLPISLLWVCPLQSILNSAASGPVNWSSPSTPLLPARGKPRSRQWPPRAALLSLDLLITPHQARQAPASGLWHWGSPPWNTFSHRSSGSLFQCQLRTRAQPRTCLNLHSLSLSLLYFSPSTEYYLTHYCFTYELVYFPPPECKFHKCRKWFFVVVFFLVTTVSPGPKTE